MKRLALFCALIVLGTTFTRADDSGNTNTQQPAFISLTRTALDPEDLPTNTSVMTFQQMEQLNVQNVGQAVAYMTGVDVTNTGSLGSLILPSIRGFSSSRVQIVIDDQPLPANETGDFDLSQIPADTVERIEVVRGGDSVAYGANAEGGVIHIITKHAVAAEPNLSLSTQYGSYNTQDHRLEFGDKSGPAEAYFTVNRQLSNGFQQNSDYHDLSFSGNTAYDFGAVGKTSFRFFVNNNDMGVPSGTPVPIGQWNGTLEQQANDPTYREQNHTQTLQFQHEVPLGDLGSVKARFDADDSRISSNSTLDPFVDGTNKVMSRTGTLLAELPFGLSGGADYQRQFLESSGNGNFDTTNWAVFLQDHQEFMKKLSVILGYRHDQSLQYGPADDPALTLVYKATDWLKLSSNINRAFHAPTFADIYGLGDPPSPNLKPETSMHYDAGFEVIPFDGFSAKTTVFRADTQNKIVADPNQNFQSFNLTESHDTGVEEEINFKTGPVTQQLNYTYVNSEAEAADTDNFQLSPYSPHNIGNYLLSAALPEGFEASSNVHYVDEQFTDINRGGLVIPSYAVWGMKIAKNVHWGQTQEQVYFGVDNVMNNHYAENADDFNGYYPQPGRTFYGGLSFKLWS